MKRLGFFRRFNVLLEVWSKSIMQPVQFSGIYVTKLLGFEDTDPAWGKKTFRIVVTDDENGQDAARYHDIIGPTSKPDEFSFQLVDNDYEYALRAGDYFPTKSPAWKRAAADLTGAPYQAPSQKDTYKKLGSPAEKDLAMQLVQDLPGVQARIKERIKETIDRMSLF